jgi:hypothetical protein
MPELRLRQWDCMYYLRSRQRRGGIIIIYSLILRTKYRKQANAADNKAATIIIDSLINFEAVKVDLNKF